MKTSLLFLGFLITHFSISQNIVFTDANFKAKLLSFNQFSTVAQNLIGENLDIDANNDNEISLTEASNVSLLTVSGDNVTNLQGIEFFTNVKTLYLNTNNVASVNLSTLINLETLTIGSFYFGAYPDGVIGILSSLDLSSNTNLKKLYLETCSITDLDLTNNANLTDLTITQEKNYFNVNIDNLLNLRNLTYYSNFINTNLDFSTNNNLLSMYLQGSGFSSLNLSNLPILYRLEVSNTNVTTLDLSNNVSLEVVYLANNELQNLNLGNINYVTNLNVENNSLSTLNANNLNFLQFLDCSNNMLTELFIKNNSFEASLTLENNPNLTYVCCDSVQIIPVQNKLNQSGQYNVTVNANCVTGSSLATSSFDSDKEITMYPNPASTFISFNSVSTIDKIEVFDINGRKVIETKNTTLNIENIQKGMYFAKVISENESQILKFIKE